MSGLWRHWYWQLSVSRLFWKSAWTPFVRETCSCAWCPKYLFLILSLEHCYGSSLIHEVKSCIHQCARCCLQWSSRKPAWAQSSYHRFFNNISSRSGVLEAVEPHCVPKCGCRSLSGLHSFILRCHCTACNLMVALLCRTRVGLAEEETSHSPASTCLNLMWFTSGFPMYGFRVNVHRVRDSCVKLEILTRRVFLCLVFTCSANSLWL